MKKDEIQNPKRFRELRKIIKLYITPLVTVLIFFSIIVFLLIPKLSEIFSGLEEITNLNQEVLSLNEEYSTLNLLASQSNFLVAQLKVINETATTGNTEVVKFRDTVTELCNNNSIRIVSQTLSEGEIIDSETLSQNKGLVLQEIPFNFEISGQYSNILGFINDLSALEEFIIVREMSLTGSSTGDGGVQSSMKLRIDKYQFIVRDEALMQSTYLSVPETAEMDVRVLEYIENKVN